MLLLYPEQGAIAELYHDRDTDLNLVKATYKKSTSGSFCLVEWKSRDVTISS